MNKELNIFTLRMLRDQYEAEHMETEVEALDAAIEALEQPDLQPTCNQLATDCISRQAAIDALDAMCKFYKKYIDYDDGEGFVDAIKELPSAQPEIIRCKDCKYRGEEE